jgi:hypothetical protein
MAEIRVDNKEGNKSPIWPWILGALLLIGLIWGVSELLSRDDDDTRMTRTEERTDRGVAYDSEADRVNTATTGYEAQGPIGEYLLFVDRNDEEADLARTNVSERPGEQADRSAEMGLEHEYTREGLRKLSAALNALATASPADANIDQQRQTFQQRAEQLGEDPQSLQHANMIRQTFTEAADLMASIKERSYPNSDADVEEVRKAAQDIDVNTQTLNQKDEVREFFRKAGEAIQEMDEDRHRNRNLQQNPENNPNP